MLAKKSDSVGRRKMPTSKLLCAVALLQAALALPLAQLKAKPPKEPPKIAVTSASEFRTLMDGGATAYARLWLLMHEIHVGDPETFGPAFRISSEAPSS